MTPFNRYARKDPFAFVLALGLGLSACSDDNPLAAVPEAPSFASGAGWVEEGGLMTINFDQPPIGPWGWNVGSTYWTRGVILYQAAAYDYVNDFPGFRRARRLAPISGDNAIGLGDYDFWWGDAPFYWQWYYTPDEVAKMVLRSQRRDWRMEFLRPVSEVSFFVRTQSDFLITCYNRAGGKLASRLVEGKIAPGGSAIRDVEWFLNSPGPYPATEVVLAASGISRCEIASDGGILDDLSFRPEAEADVTAICTPARVTRGSPVRCSVKIGGNAAGTLISRSASGVGFRFEERPNSPILRGDSAVWEGRAVASTTVQFTVEVTEGTQTQLRSIETSFDVTAPRGIDGEA